MSDVQYPMIVTEEEIIKKFDEKVYKMRIDSVVSFIDKLKRDYKKYRDKKRSYQIVKNVSLISDIVSGKGLAIAGLVLGFVSGGTLLIPSLIMGSFGVGIGSILSMLNKVCDIKGSKYVKLESLAKNKLSEIMVLFSKVMKDGKVNHEEYEIAMKAIDNYKTMKDDIKTKSKKQMDKVKLSKKESEEIEKELKKEIKEKLKLEKKEELKKWLE